MSLGRWAVIDIETTGMDANYDAIIDIGFLQFEENQLVRKYSSLVRTENRLSQFIQKLTGIKESQVQAAPLWSTVEPELLELEGHHLVAHNASFEKMFIEKYFDSLGDQRDLEYYQDSIFYLGLLDPSLSSLSLENLIVYFKIAEKEEHRGLSDSLDLLKVMLIATFKLKRDANFNHFFMGLVNEFTTEDFWFKKFANLEVSDLEEIAEQIDFDLHGVYGDFLNSLEKNEIGTDVETAYDLKFSGDNIKQILRDEEGIKNRIPEYQFRESQEKLSLRIGQAFGNGIHALIQAPTGTGKTLGYLLPSVLLAKNKAEQVMVSTGTKALQNQAMTKDIPLIFKMLGLGKFDLKVVRLVGSNNHFCELLYRNEAEAGENLLDIKGFDEKFTQAFYEVIFFQNQRVADYSDIITADSIPHVIKRKIPYAADFNDKIRVDYRACTGNKCPFKADCTYLGGMKRAKEANIIVGNHALLLSWPRAIEKPPYIVIDEAHKIESESTQMFTQELGEKELQGFAKNLPSMISPIYYLLGEADKGVETTQRIRREVASSAKLIAENIEKLAEFIERYAKKRPRFTDIYWNEFPMIDNNKMNDSLEVSLFNQVDSLRYIFKGVYDLVFPLIGKWNLNSLTDDNEITALTLFEASCANIEDAVGTLNNVLDNNVERASSLKFHSDYGFSITSAPINVGELFYEAVIKDSESVILTSATLANSDGTKGMAQVEWMTGYNLLPSEKRFRTGMFLDNNYDYENNANVFLCTDVPPLYDQQFVPEVMEKIIPIIRDLGGRTLLLFSARVRFDKACEFLLKAFDGEIPLFIQGLGLNVVEDFKKSSNGILVGMESFSEGIDVPGEKLEFIYIDKVPDLRQDLVIQKRRDFYEANFGNEFNDYFLAHRTRSLHQKLGRLIRREKDRGCIIITDSRLARWKGRTLDTFKDMMKPYKLNITDLDTACEKTREFLL